MEAPESEDEKTSSGLRAIRLLAAMTFLVPLTGGLLEKTDWNAVSGTAVGRRRCQGRQ